MYRCVCAHIMCQVLIGDGTITAEKIHIGFETTYAASQSASTSGVSLLIPAGRCQTTFCLSYSGVALPAVQAVCGAL